MRGITQNSGEAMGTGVYYIVGFVLVAFVVIGIYNWLVRLRNGFRNAFAQIDVQLKRRYDLIPNLIETVKGYMKHERETLDAVVRARNAAQSAAQAAAHNPGDAEAMSKLAQSEGQLNAGLSRLFALSESYPDLKASQNMICLQEELVSTENKVAFARQAYNDVVTEYNTAIETFPALVLAALFGFKVATLLECIEAPEERAVPKVSFEREGRVV
jgi:LemA protein